MLATVEKNQPRKLVNFRVPHTLMESFDSVCRFNARNRTQILIELMKTYVDDEYPVMEHQHQRHQTILKSFHMGSKR